MGIFKLFAFLWHFFYGDILLCDKFEVLLMKKNAKYSLTYRRKPPYFFIFISGILKKALFVARRTAEFTDRLSSTPPAHKRFFP